ncbi:hypothetical protein C5167_028494 [Papaver somniferum]|uniref:uncharacterized protein LOC113338932 n=1 Tax=Papaver somniferum TaxID=3469 RepID=UPI000E6F8B4D|nr:uncharacterized protein LOC113338932 [Papaver somniferum]RZC90662.1 hypothetical protein C5167_028494 [Papaver somniferum]
MEDSITETELKTGTEDFNQMDDDKVMKSSTEQRKQEEEEEGSKRSGGIVNHLISNLVTPSSPRLPRGLSNGFSATTEADYKEDEENKSSVDVEMGGGIINNFISNIFHSSSAEGDHGEVKENHNNTEGVTDVEEREVQEHIEVEVNGGSGGGIINNLITNLFHQNESDGSQEAGVEMEKKSEAEEEVHDNASSEGNGEHVKMEEEKSNGGIISNLVSNLEENYDPGNDEASIMIHSIIHD